MSDQPERIWASSDWRRIDQGKWWDINPGGDAEEYIRADRIEALCAELNTCRMAQAVTDNTVADLEAKLKTSEEIGRAFEEDAGQLREKLAAAVEALRWYHDQMCEGFCNDLRYDSTYTTEMDDKCSGCKARATLAEIKGESHE